MPETLSDEEADDLSEGEEQSNAADDSNPSEHRLLDWHVTGDALTWLSTLVAAQSLVNHVGAA